MYCMRIHALYLHYVYIYSHQTPKSSKGIYERKENFFF